MAIIEVPCGYGTPVPQVNGSVSMGIIANLMMVLSIYMDSLVIIPFFMRLLLRT